MSLRGRALLRQKSILQENITGKYVLCLSEDLSVVTSQCSVIVRDFALWGVDRATHGLPSKRLRCTVGVLAGTHWGDVSFRVMSHQSSNPLWLCRAGGHGRDRGHDCHVDLSCGRRSYTHSSSTPPRLVRSGC